MPMVGQASIGGEGGYGAEGLVRAPPVPAGGGPAAILHHILTASKAGQSPTACP